jgi:hypothetical protein
MNCADVHLSLGADPGVSSPQLEAHLRECAPCAQFRREMLRLDDAIRRALMIDMEASGQGTAVGAADSAAASTAARPRVSTSPRLAGFDAGAQGSRTSAMTPAYSGVRQWALAASVLLAVAVVLAMWGALPRHSLAADVVSHVISEPIDQPLDAAVDESAVRDVMERSGLRLDPINPSIVFVRTCFLRGRLVPHFIVRTEHGTATVMILPDEHVKSPERFDGSGYKGLIIPDSGSGSIAVLSRSDVDMERYAGEIRRAVHSLPPETGA